MLIVALSMAFVLSLTLDRTIANGVRTFANGVRTFANSAVPGTPWGTRRSADFRSAVNICLDKVNTLSRKATHPTWGRVVAFHNQTPIRLSAELRSSALEASVSLLPDLGDRFRLITGQDKANFRRRARPDHRRPRLSGRPRHLFC